MNQLNAGIIGVSIFYNKEEWHQLINLWLKPFFSKNKELFDSYYLYFSDEQGEHIRVNIKLSMREASGLRTKLKNDIEEFLLTHPSKVNQRKYWGDSFFMDFDNNSHCFDLFKPYSDRTELLKLNSVDRLRYALSSFILNQLAKEEINEDSIYAFVLYQLFVITEAIYDNLEEALCDIRGTLNKMFLQGSTRKQVTIECQSNLIVHENSAELTKIAKEIWTSQAIASPFHWLNDLKNICKDLTSDVNDKRPLFLQLSSILFEHVNMRKSDMLILSTSVMYQTLLNIKNISLRFN